MTRESFVDHLVVASFIAIRVGALIALLWWVRKVVAA